MSLHPLRRWLPALVWACLLPTAAGAVDSAGVAKTIFIGLDGVRADALISSGAPNIFSLVHGTWADGYHGSFAYYAQTIQDSPQLTTVEGVPSVQSGVGYVKRTSNDWTAMPHFLTTLKTINPALTVADLSGGGAALADYAGGGSDAQQTANAVSLLNGTFTASGWTTGRNVDAMYLWLGNPDEAGHSFDFAPTSAGYLNAIRDADAQVGQILAAVKSRPTFAAENWQVVITTDHGGQYFTHGAKNTHNKTIPLVVSSKEALQGQMSGSPSHLDVAPTVVAHMAGAASVPAWYDGAIRGGSVQAKGSSLADGLVTYLRFQGNYNDSSGRGNNAAIGPDSANPPLVMSNGGKFGKYVNLHNWIGEAGASTYLTLGHPADLDFGTDTSYTIATWYRPRSDMTTSPVPARGVLIGNKDNSGGSVWTSTSVNAGTELLNFETSGFGMNVGDGSQMRLIQPAVYKANAWYFVAATFDRGGNCTLHVGEPGGAMWALTDTMSPLGDVNSLLPWNIGQDGTGVNAANIDGDLDDLAIWRRTLSLDELQQLFNGGTGRELATLIPEPGSAVLLLAGIGAALRRRRK